MLIRARERGDEVVKERVGVAARGAARMKERIEEVKADIHIPDPLVAEEQAEAPASTEQVLQVISILKDAGITCCIAQTFALDRVLCVPDQDHQGSVQLFNSRDDILKPCGSSSHSAPTSPIPKYPRFKSFGSIGFWLLVPESYCHVECKQKIWNTASVRGLPYPKLHVLLEDLIDGMDLTEKWGEENLNLLGSTDTPWLGNHYQALRDDFREKGLDEMLIFLDPAPTPRREVWQHSVRNTQKRLGWKRSPENHSSRYREHGSIDPRTPNRPSL
ncbi:uncharacterized protein BDV17DRAFT_279384 [Aspergillus undulatus]|uniref:uncharacterized protein n=1 Tax=Aspergillus undulatus TaxID=1810928 RepID=UPI003CCD9BD9